MQKRRLTLLSALLLSVLLHAVIVGGGELALPDFYHAPDEVLERKQPAHVQRVQLAARPPAAEKRAAPKGLRMVAAGIKATTPAPKPRKKTARAPDKKPAGENPPPEAAPDNAETLAEAAPEPLPEKPLVAVPPTRELAPAFPVQLTAQLEARVSGLPVVLNQSWTMEGFRYFIDQHAKKFGFRVRMTSEGGVSPEGGLLPQQSQMLINDKLHSASRYANGMIRLGRPTNPREVPAPAVPQDMASLPFHLAVTFNGQPQSVFVTTGKKLYQVRFALDAEEKLKLPIGTLRTLHLYGERLDPQLGEMVRAYEIWLAPDYLNYPVKVEGHLSGGERFEYRLRSLEIEGKLVLGERGDLDIAAPDEAIPEWLQQRAQPEGLNKP
jgi:hypothetical protein